MSDPTSSFLEQLPGRGRIPALERTSGALRIELDRNGQPERWRLEFRRGSITVSRSDGDADCVLQAAGTLFDDLVTGRSNAMAATLRGELQVAGDPGLLVRFQRLLPPPTGRTMAASSRTVGKRRS